MTEQGSRWILERLREFEKNFDSDIFKYFSTGLTARPTEYFQRQCYFGASMLSPEDAALRHQIGVNKLMRGSDSPHIEGTWPKTMESLQATFGPIESEAEVRTTLGGSAAEVFGFDVEQMQKIADRVGPSLAEIRGEA